MTLSNGTGGNTQECLSEIESLVIRFAGDSGDGIQVTGSRFTQESALRGNDLSTYPSFPAEIRAPAGSLPGVSSFQVQIGSRRVFTAGDEVDVLVCMNPAALKANLQDLKENGVLICNSDAFNKKNLTRVGYEINPLEEQELGLKYTLITVPLNTLTAEALKETSLSKREVDRSKNFFALGIICWLFGRSIEDTIEWLNRKFASRAEIAEANRLAVEGGMAFAQASELFPASYQIKPAHFEPGIYRNITGNLGIAYGLLAASQLSGLGLFYSGYPITPASDILHEMSRHKNFGVITFQAEDEIAACCAAIGASYAGKLAVTVSSGPGIALKQEAIGLAVCAELPLVIIDVQRAGPSTGMPTKTEQADLLEVLFGRNGESPVAVVAVASPDDAFDATVDACRISLKHMVPVFLLSDAAIGNSSHPWKLPELDKLEPFTVKRVTEGPYQPYARDPESLARAWALPGTPACEHRLGGLEKQDVYGHISYDPENHQRMTELRAEKVRRIAKDFKPTRVTGEESGELLVISWGSTYGPVTAAVRECLAAGNMIGHIHLRYLNPLPEDLTAIMKRFKKVLVPEMNTGQLAMLLRAKTLIDVKSYCKVQGQPFKVSELVRRIVDELRGNFNAEGIA
ncbi:MAG: 2-oxoacid:acceptor oxidoreductase subunit alpha [Candidatus Dadabacteria bacterium]|nr:MAG: 2-oxoacid:acceptor oxidoreductase subunit alpha [Candidatus Dadabacteria bacterium]